MDRSLLRQGYLRGGFQSERNGVAEVQWTISADQTTPGDSSGNWWNGFLVEDRTDETMGAVGGFGEEYTNIGRMMVDLRRETAVDRDRDTLPLSFPGSSDNLPRNG